MTMTIKQIKETVSRVLKIGENAVEVGPTSTTVTCSLDVNYDTLAELAAAVGTTNINFVYQEGEPGYSSWTPGTDGWFSFTIGIGAQV
jgi:hypothetical protein